FPVLGLRYDSFAVPYRAGPRHQGAPRSTLASFAGLKLSKNCTPAFQSPLPFSHGRKRVQRYYIFHYTQHFLQLFFKYFSFIWKSIRYKDKKTVEARHSAPLPVII
ncbi:MAG: hypothetical protein IKU00_04365, partial [Bacteroidales bacterium]|nr:hypothetical protein [Bacteroidales bacterium]